MKINFDKSKRELHSLGGIYLARRHWCFFWWILPFFPLERKDYLCVCQPSTTWPPSSKRCSQERPPSANWFETVFVWIMRFWQTVKARGASIMFVAFTPWAIQTAFGVLLFPLLCCLKRALIAVFVNLKVTKTIFGWLPGVALSANSGPFCCVSSGLDHKFIQWPLPGGCFSSGPKPALSYIPSRVLIER